MDKTIGVLFTRRVAGNNIKLTFNGKHLKMANSAKYLGIIFDNKLTWTEHIKYIEEKCKKRLNLMRSIAGNTWGASKKSLLTIYRALIRSILDYRRLAAAMLYLVVLMNASGVNLVNFFCRTAPPFQRQLLMTSHISISF